MAEIAVLRRVTSRWSSSSAAAAATSSSVFSRLVRSVSSLPSSAAVFDTCVKSQHRARGATAALRRLERGEFVADPLQSEIASRLVDRLAEVKRQFKRVFVLGGAAHALLPHLVHALDTDALEDVVVADVTPENLRVCDVVMEQLDVLNSRVYRSIRLNSDAIESRSDGSFEAIGEDRFDLVVACLGLHWHNDLVTALRKIQRSLEPDGLFLGCLFGEETMYEMRVSCMIAEAERESGFEAQRVSPMALVRDAGALLSSAGFALPAVDVDAITMRYRTPFDAVRHVRAMAESAAPVGGTKRVRLESAIAAQAIYQRRFGDDGSAGGGVPATFQVINLTGWSPHASQSKPARRGSATASLADIEQFLPPPVFTPIHEHDAQQDPPPPPPPSSSSPPSEQKKNHDHDDTTDKTQNPSR